ncbi:outer membrane protein assembly factor BamD [Flavicella sediminum]|uniref:outer membrane protein assembly factor BamD n=1 Tax=Flavicella sediminum TaxID=2585141 RepID=UPI001FB587BE|nr:outer membrane protein assembly factor BamD [Flavicella sediminum]
MRNLTILLFVATILMSCSNYNKVLNKGTTTEKYKMATDLYEAKKFSKALRLFEMITPAYKGKPQMERIQFMVAQSYFNTKDFFNAAYYFERFSTNYPKSSKKEEAEFTAAKSYYLASPKYSLDQADTKKALASFQKYINAYPDSKRLSEANEMVKGLQYKLEKKSFEIAKQYYEIGYYNSAIVSFDNMTSEFLGTSFREEALFYKLKASYELGMRSTERKKLPRIEAAIKAYDKLKRNYPNSEFLKESDKLLETLQQEKKVNS